MYHVATAPDAPEHLQSLLFLPPALVETQESDPLEEVAFFRDEMANVVWGVERTVQGGGGHRRRPLRGGAAGPGRGRGPAGRP